MDFSFDLTKDDFRSFIQNNFDPARKPRRFSLGPTLPFVKILVFFGALSSILTQSWLPLGLSLPFSVMWIYAMLRENRNYDKRLIDAKLQLLSDGAFDHLLGHHEVSFRDDIITERSNGLFSEMTYDGILRIDETVNHFFIYIVKGFSLIIPKRSTSEEAMEFIRGKSPRGDGS